MKTERHQVDIAVVGGGLTGICAALSAARHGVKVALVHD
ncbi:MAG TPA: FAD-dependent oxidoreductase, partial [bacterium]|nr:FAD-dependent oxidoreductase [bacterium]